MRRTAQEARARAAIDIAIPAAFLTELNYAPRWGHVTHAACLGVANDMAYCLQSYSVWQVRPQVNITRPRSLQVNVYVLYTWKIKISGTFSGLWVGENIGTWFSCKMLIKKKRRPC